MSVHKRKSPEKITITLQSLIERIRVGKNYMLFQIFTTYLKYFLNVNKKYKTLCNIVEFYITCHYYLFSPLSYKNDLSNINIVHIWQ